MLSVALRRKKTKTWRLCRRVCPKVQFDRKCAVVLVYAALTAVTIYSNALLRPRPRCGGERGMDGKGNARGERKGEEKEVKGKRMGGKEKGTKPREEEEKGKEKRGRGREREEFCAVVIFLRKTPVMWVCISLQVAGSAVSA